MKSRSLKFILLVVTVLALTVSLFACNTPGQNPTSNVFTITYAAGDGATGSYPTATYVKDATVTLPDGTALAKENYTFTGWTDGTSTYAGGSAYTMPASNVTLTAVWQENAPTTYTLTYVAGEGATGSYQAAAYEAGAAVTLPDGTALAKENHTFGGWTDGTTNYAAGAAFTMPANDVTLTAVWQENAPTTYTLVYAAGEGATGSYQAATYEAGATVTLPDGTALAKENYTFGGWTDGTNTYEAGAAFTMPANDVTLTAVWTENTTGGEDNSDVIKVYANPDGDTTIVKIEHNATQNIVTVIYNAGFGGDKSIVYHLTDAAEGDWTVDETDTDIFGSDFAYINLAEEGKLKLTNEGCVAYLTFTLDTGAGEGGGNEGGNEGGDEADDPNDTIIIFGNDGAFINGYTVTEIKYNQTKSRITVTYDDGLTVTYKLHDWDDGDWLPDNDGDGKKDADTIFGNLYCITITPVGDPTTCQVRMAGFGAATYTFEVEGAGGNDPQPPAGEDIDKTYEIVTDGPYATTEVAGNTIDKLVYNAAKKTIVVTYNGDQTVTYTLTVGEPVYGIIDAWTIVEADHIFTADFAGFVIEEDNIGLYVGYDVLNFALATSGEGGNEGEGGNGDEVIPTAPVYTNNAGVTIGANTITSIEFNESNCAILVTYNGTETATYVIEQDLDGTWLVMSNEHIFGMNFGWIEITETELLLCGYDSVYNNALFTVGGAGGNGGEVIPTASVYTNNAGVTIGANTITSIEFNESNCAILVTYNGTETATYVIEQDLDGTWLVMSNEHIFGMNFGWIEITETELLLCGYDPIYNNALFTVGGAGGNEGGDETDDVIKVFTHTGAEVNGNLITVISHNETKETITVTYNDGTGEKTVIYQLSDYGDGDWKINETTIFGEDFKWVTFPENDATVCKLNFKGYGVQPIIFNAEGSDNEDSDEITGEDIDKTYEIVTEGPYAITEVAGNTIDKLVYNAAKKTIVVTYNGDQTVTYTLTVGEPMYGQATLAIVEEDHIFTADFKGFVINDEYAELYVGWDVLSFNPATTGEGGNEDVGGGDDNQGGGNEGGNVSGAPVYTNNAGVTIGANTITSIEFNESNCAILVTYNGTETATYVIEQDLDGTWLVMSNEHIFGMNFGWIEITETELLLCGYDSIYNNALFTVVA